MLIIPVEPSSPSAKQKKHSHLVYRARRRFISSKVSNFGAFSFAVKRMCKRENALQVFLNKFL